MGFFKKLGRSIKRTTRKVSKSVKRSTRRIGRSIRKSSRFVSRATRGLRRTFRSPLLKSVMNMTPYGSAFNAGMGLLRGKSLTSIGKGLLKSSPYGKLINSGINLAQGKDPMSVLKNYGMSHLKNINPLGVGAVNKYMRPLTKVAKLPIPRSMNIPMSPSPMRQAMSMFQRSKSFRNFHRPLVHQRQLRVNPLVHNEISNQMSISPNLGFNDIFGRI